MLEVIKIRVKTAKYLFFSQNEITVFGFCIANT